MFHSVSWHTYWTAIITASLVYYIIVYVAYFRPALNSALTGKWFANFSTSTELTDADETIPASIPRSLETSVSEVEDHVIQACIEELNAFFENQKKSRAIKTELMHSLHILLCKYPSLKSSAYKEALSNVIATQCENICSIHLNADELKGVWMG